MQFTKNTSSGKGGITGIVIKLTLGLIVVIGIVVFINSLDFPSKLKIVPYNYCPPNTGSAC